jgi:para-nitrobenzyl esterase
MSNARKEPVVEVAEGALRGSWVGDVAVFKGVPYAAPPIGALRFEPPQPGAPWPQLRDATISGPIAPQLPSRLNRIMGDFEMPAGEDCLTLNIWTPTLDEPPAPVLFWLHGGAFTSGAGSIGWYSGQNFAANGRILVVSINYRLGPLGFLYWPGLSQGNLGLLDQIAALRWVKANIARFGGDPHAITVAGQSAGARSTGHLMAHADAAPLFRRAILQSGPLGQPPAAPDRAAATARDYLALLDISTGNAAELRRVPADKLIKAAAELGRRSKRFADSRVPFNTVLDGGVLSGDALGAVERGAAPGIDVLVGTTRDESAAHLIFDEEVAQASEATVRAHFTELFGAAGEARLDEVRRMRPAASAYAILVQLATDTTFARSSVAFAAARARHGERAFLYRFDWQSPLPRLGACHCLEIPFVFDNFADWPGAPMLAGADPAETAGLARAMHRAWIAFVKTGDPNHAGIPAWPRYNETSRATMRFDTVIESAGDLAAIGSGRA